jgi:hypothetical protein
MRANHAVHYGGDAKKRQPESMQSRAMYAAIDVQYIDVLAQP